MYAVLYIFYVLRIIVYDKIEKICDKNKTIRDRIGIYTFDYISVRKPKAKKNNVCKIETRKEYRIARARESC